MKSTAILLVTMAALAGADLLLVERDVRDLIPLDSEVTVYYVQTDWFIAEAPEGWGEILAPSADGLYLAHLSDPEAAVPGTILLERNGVVLFRPSAPLPMRALEGIFHIAPLRPYSAKAFLPPVPLAPFHDRDMIEEILDLLDEDSLKSHIQTLEDFQTRLCVAPEFFQSALWVADKFDSYGLEAVEVDTFDFVFYGNTYESANVHAELPGTLPDPGIVLITAHLDAITYTNPYTFAPGADDNASGSATVLEAARTFSQYEFPNTVRFVCFGAEELGLFGSAYYAENAAAAGENIVAVMNLDMILFGPDSLRALFVPFDSQSSFIAGMFGEAAASYVPELQVNVVYSPGTVYSDHASFWANGFAALLGIEAAVNDNPYYHQETDLLANYEEYWPFGTECARAALAFTAEAALTDWLGIEGAMPPLPELSVFPNPASASVNVRVGGIEADMVSLYDLSGRRVLLAPGGSPVDVAGLSSGVYLLRAEAGDLSRTARLLVVR